MSTKIIFAPGEQQSAETAVRPSVIAFWLKTTLAVTNRRFVGSVPNTIFGVIPLGSETLSMPLGNVAGVTVNTQFSVGRAFLGLLLAVLGCICFGFGGGIVVLGIVLVIFGLAGLLNALSARLVVQNNAGGSRDVIVSIVDKGRIEAFAEEVNQRLFADNDALRHEQSMNVQNAQLYTQQAQLNAQILQQQQNAQQMPPQLGWGGQYGAPQLPSGPQGQLNTAPAAPVMPVGFGGDPARQATGATPVLPAMGSASADTLPPLPPLPPVPPVR
ncbi:hypothetical protein [Pseudoclavibacter sp. 13-3]|uniref:hypothetical protein n=1 Tax=Pseudoclavibacter sp. 13-3 TaxID=2901228 RepID=UPI001E339932|nr:hypothetical protein [Pseudoclavibacter sp. 13-3]MCD7101744.1 hypothetical protein [Pseudoclavibacter sp. 13-3]